MVEKKRVKGGIESERDRESERKKIEEIII